MYKIMFSVAAVILLFPYGVFAHGGGLDGLGCHHNRKLGGYHCHKGRLAGQVFSSKHEALNLHPMSENIPAAQIMGNARIVDGDTMWVGDTKIRLFGIDAPEAKQKCKDATGNIWMAGQDATEFLRRLTDGKEVTCLLQGKDKYRRVIGTCKIEYLNINAEMIKAGLAMAYRKYSYRYIDEETSAQKSRTGMWAGKCDPPWIWRKKRN
jgi:endonuclease YncB( thermonuclease family)